MAEKIISPGVFQRETDESFISPAPVSVGAAIIGPTVRGPELQPTVVTSFGDYKNKFGTTFYSGSDKYEYFTSIAVQKYFANGGNSMLITRVVSGAFESAVSTRILCNSGSADGEYSTASIDFTSNLPGDGEGFRVTTPSGELSFIGYSGSSAAFGIGVNGIDILRYTGGDLTNLAAGINTSSSLVGFTASLDGNTLILTSSVAGTGLNGYKIQTGSISQLLTSLVGAGGLSVVAEFAGGTDALAAINDDNNTAFTLKTIGKGTILNNCPSTNPTNIEEYSDNSLVSGSSDNLRWEVSGINNIKGTFNLEIRRGDDNSLTPIVLETFIELSLDPNSDRYIEKVIGNQYITHQTYEGQTIVTVEGDYPNNSKFVYVSNVNKKTPYYLNNNGSVATNSEGLSYSASLPLPTSGAFCNGVGGILPTEAGNYFHNINSDNTQGLTAGDYTTAINILKNQDEYRFTTIAAPGIYNSQYPSVVSSLIELCELRGDCFYIADLVRHGDSIASVVSEANELNTNFAGAYWPWVQTPSVELNRNVWTPVSTVMQGVYAYNDGIAAPWFAPAGLNRGGLPVIKAEIKLPKGLRDILYNSKVNPIATFPNTSGVTAWGQKTLQTKASALDRINVRRLLISLKNFIGDTARNLVFEQNTTVTRNKFLNAVNPFLESVQQRQGLYAFRVIMNETNNTADVIDRNQLVGQILLQPTKTAEYIILDYVVKPTGATFGE